MCLRGGQDRWKVNLASTRSQHRKPSKSALRRMSNGNITNLLRPCHHFRKSPQHLWRRLAFVVRDSGRQSRSVAGWENLESHWDRGTGKPSFGRPVLVTVLYWTNPECQYSAGNTTNLLGLCSTSQTTPQHLWRKMPLAFAEEDPGIHSQRVVGWTPTKRIMQLRMH